MSGNGDEIARIAFESWQAEGEPEGRDHEHWMRAKRIVQEGRGDVEFPNVGAAEGVAADKPRAAGSATPPSGSEPVRELGGRVDKGVIDELRDSGSPAGAPESLRNPEPQPRTNADGYVAVPSVDDAAAGSTGRDRTDPPSALDNRERRA